MNIIYILKILIIIFVVTIKAKVACLESGVEPTRKEFCVDLIKISCIFLSELFINSLHRNTHSVWPISLDIITLFIYLFLILSKKYDYNNRKVIIGIYGMILIQALVAIPIIEIIFYTKISTALIIAQCFTKGIIYYCIGAWCCSSYEHHKDSLFKKILVFTNDTYSFQKKYFLIKQN